MFVSDAIQNAVKKTTRFDFIDSSISVIRENAISSHRGQAQAWAHGGSFAYHFTPRTPFPQAWSARGGYLGHEQGETASHGFLVSGVERNSASWSGHATELKLKQSGDGIIVHGTVDEWSRTDSKAVHAPFLRVVVPGRQLYPAINRHMPGKDEKAAVVRVQGMDITFRHHGNYSEISVLGNKTMPVVLTDILVAALGRILGREVHWVYRERHDSGQRIISVRATEEDPASADSMEGAALPEYNRFWGAYAEMLSLLLKEPGEETA